MTVLWEEKKVHAGGRLQNRNQKAEMENQLASSTINQLGQYNKPTWTK